METKAEYRVEQPLYPTDTREQVLRSPYFQRVASIAEALIISRGICFSRELEPVIDDAIAFTDKLIEKVGERS
jgi:hypothetical protein